MFRLTLMKDINRMDTSTNETNNEEKKMERVEIVLKNTRANWPEFIAELKSHMPQLVCFGSDIFSGDFRTVEIQGKGFKRLGEYVYNKNKSIPFVLVYYV